MLVPGCACVGCRFGSNTIRSASDGAFGGGLYLEYGAFGGGLYLAYGSSFILCAFYVSVCLL